LANLYFQHEEDPDSAEPFYRKAYELNGSVRYFVCEPLFGFKC
jgi:ABC-type transporter lipoprotein component MlaA